MQTQTSEPGAGRVTAHLSVALPESSPLGSRTEPVAPRLATRAVCVWLGAARLGGCISEHNIASSRQEACSSGPLLLPTS